MPTLEQKIRKHNPELQELTPGCIVKEDGKLETVIKYIHMDYDEDCSEVYTTGHTDLYQKKWRYSESPDDTLQIIGHPIELRHILIAIEKSGKHVAIKENGHFVGQHVGTHIQSTGIDLSLPFPHWSPEVHEFINKLID